MKNALLILLMLLLPWQANAAAQRNFEHVIRSQHSGDSFIKHYAEHVELVMHHHDSDDDGGLSHDDAEKSARHLADVDHGFNFNVLFPALHAVATLPTASLARAPCLYRFDDRNTPPPRRPPRALV